MRDKNCIVRDMICVLQEGGKLLLSGSVLQNSLETLSKDMSIQHIETYLDYWGCLIVVNLSCKLSLITSMSEKHPKTTRLKLCCEKLCTSHDVKSFVIGSFLKCFVVKIANDYFY